MATRWRWPPESASGCASLLSREAELPSSAARVRSACFRATPWSSHRREHAVLEHGEVREELEASGTPGRPCRAGRRRRAAHRRARPATSIVPRRTARGPSGSAAAWSCPRRCARARRRAALARHRGRGPAASARARRGCVFHRSTTRMLIDLCASARARCARRAARSSRRDSRTNGRPISRYHSATTTPRPRWSRIELARFVYVLVSSVSVTSDTSELSFSSAMKSLVIGGIATRTACGRTT